MALTFGKYQGAGNDFIVVDAASEDVMPTELAAQLCDRRFGIGADGVLLVLPPRGASGLARMKVINADGSIPEMCGNGLRCVALHLARKHRLSELTVDTDAGDKACVILDGAETRVRIDMGPVVVSDEVRIEAPAHSREPHAYRFVRANAGNPHAVTFEPASRSVIEVVGPFVEKHALFPQGTNVEFAELTKDGIDLVVWERGCGITHACGTGACATVAVAVSKKMIPRSVACRVRLPGGTLLVTIDDVGRATLEGPAEHVFSGSLAARGAS
jgi:diaminopimelate epimerase